LKFEEDLYNEKKLNVKKIFQIKKIISVFNHVIGPLSNHFNSLIDDDSFFFEEKKDFFNQLVSHLGSIKHDVGLLEDTVNTLTDLSLNITQYKMNKTVTVLTIFSAVFIPLSFLSGVFGMNFEYMPFIDNQYGFYFFIATSIVLVSIMLFFIKGTNDEK
jgi:magnesium transporter